MNSNRSESSSVPESHAQTLRRQWGLAHQFRRPSGWLGGLVGRIMAAQNAPMNGLAVELLDVQPDDQILEVGFGPGQAVELLAARAMSGFVAGIDLSEVMVRQAARRNRAAVEAGRVELCQGTVSRLPYPDGRFTKAVAVNSFHLWPNPADDLGEVRRVLREGGLLLLCLRMEHWLPRFLVPPGFTEDEVRVTLDRVRQAGFRQVRTERRDVGREVTCVLATC